MKNAILLLLWLCLFIIGLEQINPLVWRIVFGVAWLVVLWIFIELKRCPEMPPDYDDKYNI